MSGAEDVSDRPDPGAVWERHARWWQAEFTEGADVEYTEQLLPLAARHMRGASSVSGSCPTAAAPVAEGALGSSLASVSAMCTT